VRKSLNDIDTLNAKVEAKARQLADQSKLSGDELSPEVSVLLKTGDFAVYKDRFTLLPVLFSLCGFLMVAINAYNPLLIAVSFVCSFLWYDIYSGILHVVLDNPRFIAVPLLGPPCLEFQWHHHIPLDLTSKSFLQVCGDLNVVVTIVAMIFLYFYLYHQFDTPLVVTLLGFKILMAYYGQFCHRMAHTPKHLRSALVCLLQDSSLMISSKDHLKHHHDHSTNYCIGSGICNPVVSYLHDHVTSNRWIWLGTFLLSSIGDVFVLNACLSPILPFSD